MLDNITVHKYKKDMLENITVHLYNYNKYMFILWTIYIFIPVGGCVDIGPSTLASALTRGRGGGL
jgi:hypothetical protein